MPRFQLNKTAEKNQELLDHILSRGVEDGDCLLWTGYKLAGGYGRQQLEGKPITVHRLRYILEYGSIPEGLVVAHTCDEPSCFEITHLYVTTQKANVLKSIREGRHISSAERNYPRQPNGRFITWWSGGESPEPPDGY